MRPKTHQRDAFKDIRRIINTTDNCMIHFSNVAGSGKTFLAHKMLADWCSDIDERIYFTSACKWSQYKSSCNITCSQKNVKELYDYLYTDKKKDITDIEGALIIIDDFHQINNIVTLANVLSRTNYVLLFGDSVEVDKLRITHTINTKESSDYRMVVKRRAKMGYTCSECNKEYSREEKEMISNLLMSDTPNCIVCMRDGYRGDATISNASKNTMIKASTVIYGKGDYTVQANLSHKKISSLKVIKDSSKLNNSYVVLEQGEELKLGGFNALKHFNYLLLFEKPTDERELLSRFNREGCSDKKLRVYHYY